MVTLEAPSPREMQSSPVAMFESTILMLLELPTWIPSVFGLSPGAIICTELNLMLSDAKTIMWKNLLFADEMRRIDALVMKLNDRDY